MTGRRPAGTLVCPLCRRLIELGALLGYGPLFDARRGGVRFCMLRATCLPPSFRQDCEDRRCRHCRRLFLMARWRGPPRVYCSDPCNAASYRARQKANAGLLRRRAQLEFPRADGRFVSKPHIGAAAQRQTSYGHRQSRT